MRASRGIPRMGEAVPNGGLAELVCGDSTQSHESRHRAWPGGDDGGKGKQAKRRGHRGTHCAGANRLSWWTASVSPRAAALRYQAIAAA
jgi:hypothetical protein